MIGSGFIGLEAAQGLLRRGLQVTVVEALGQVLPRMLDAEMAERVQRRLESHGVDVLVSSPAEAVLGGAYGVRAVQAGGREIPCDLVVCAAGVRADLPMLDGSGIATAKGVVVDDRMQTSQPDVYAAGDIIELNGDVFPNWPNAVSTGRVAGSNMMGVDRRHAGLEAFNVVRIFDVPVASFGALTGDHVLRWEQAGTSYRKVAVTDGKVAGAQLWGDVNGAGLYHELMKKGLRHRPRLCDDLPSPRFGYGSMLRPARAMRGGAAVEGESVKIAVTGKGGVGKTTVTALLAHHFARQGRPVLAIDADPSPCLGPALGFPDDKLLNLRPIAEMGELIAERTGAPAKSSMGAFFRLNPQVSDLPERFSDIHDGIRLLAAGRGAGRRIGLHLPCERAAQGAGAARHRAAGRSCPAGPVCRRRASGARDGGGGGRDAGGGRADQSQHADGAADQGARGGHRHSQLLLLIGNKATGDDDRRFFEENAGDIPLAGCLGAAPEAVTADRTGKVLYDIAPHLAADIGVIAGKLKPAA